MATTKTAPQHVTKKLTPKAQAAPHQAADAADSEAATHRVWYICLLALGLILLAGATAFAYRRAMPAWEQSIFHAINGVHTPGWLSSQIAKQLSNAVWGLVGISVLAMLVPRLRLRAWQYVAALGSTYVFQFIVEHIVDRPRPIGMIHNVVLRAQQGGPGFPSGHEAALTAFVLTMWFYVPWPWRILLALLVIAEAWSRVFLGVHAPLDVAGGFACGLIVVAILHLAPARLRRLFRLS